MQVMFSAATKYVGDNFYFNYAGEASVAVM